MGDICSWLLRNGDEAWIAGATCDDQCMTMLVQQCGVPANRIILMDPGGRFEDFGGDVCYRLDADLVDVQWAIQIPAGGFPCAAIATMHGAVSMPPPTIFQGAISVEESAQQRHRFAHLGLPLAEVLNWCNTARFPFRERLGEGVVFIGRSFKMVNVRKVAPLYAGRIEAYGTVTAAEHIASLPANVEWRGVCDSAAVMPQARVVIGCAQVALEAMAAGRWVLCGQNLHLSPEVLVDTVPEGRIVRPANVAEISAAGQFNYRRPPEPRAEEVLAELEWALAHDAPEERRALRDWVEERHSLEAQVRKIRAFYREVAG